MKMKNPFLICLFSFLFCSCSGINNNPNWMNAYRSDKAAKMDIRDYFNGKIEGWGILENDKSIVTKRFTIKANGSWDGDKGVVQMQYFFSDGKRDGRTWLITVNDANHYSAIGHDVVGSAIGEQVDGVSRMIYDVNMVIDGTKQKVRIEEISYNIDGETIIVISSLKRFGLNKGKMIMSLRKISSSDNAKSYPAKSSDEYNAKKYLPKPMTEIKQDQGQNQDQNIDMENEISVPDKISD